LFCRKAMRGPCGASLGSDAGLHLAATAASARWARAFGRTGAACGNIGRWMGVWGPPHDETSAAFAQSRAFTREAGGVPACRGGSGVSLGRTGDEPRWLTHEGILDLARGWAWAGAASLLPSGVSFSPSLVLSILTSWNQQVRMLDHPRGGRQS
jgi:hypothetical protein